jgi:hypothetical protein
MKEIAPSPKLRRKLKKIGQHLTGPIAVMEYEHGNRWRN